MVEVRKENRRVSLPNKGGLTFEGPWTLYWEEIA
jgi:hypothetical protein